MILIKRQLLI